MSQGFNIVNPVTGQVVGNIDETTGNIQFLGNASVGTLAPLGSGGVGVLELATAGTVPANVTPGGVALYSKNGVLYYKNAQGLQNIMVGGQGGITAPFTSAAVTTEQVMQSVLIPALDPIAGAVYHSVIWGVFTTAATQGTITFTSRWGGLAGTAIATSPAIAWTASLTAAPFKLEVWLNFLTPTTVQAVQEIDLTTSTATDAASPFVVVPNGAVTVSIAAPMAWVTDVTLSAGATNSITMLAGFTERLA